MHMEPNHFLVHGDSKRLSLAMTKKKKRSPYGDPSDASAQSTKASKLARATVAPSKPPHHAKATSTWSLPSSPNQSSPLPTGGANRPPTENLLPQRMSVEELEQKKMLLPYLDKIEYINIQLRQRGLLPSDPNDALAAVATPTTMPGETPHQATAPGSSKPASHKILVRQHSDSELQQQPEPMRPRISSDRLKMRYPRLYGTIVTSTSSVLSPRIRPINWLLHLIEEIYDNLTEVFILGATAEGVAPSNNDASPRPEETASTRLFQAKLVMPFLVRKHIDHALGLVRLADQECLDLLYNVELELDRFPHVALFSLFVRELYDDDTLLFFLFVRHLLQREFALQLKHKSKLLHSSTTGKPFLASDLVHFEPHPLVPDGSMAVSLTQSACELVWRRVFAHSAELNPEIKRGVASSAVLGQYIAQEKMAVLFHGRHRVSIDAVLIWSVDAFRSIAEDIIAQYKYRDDGESLRSLLRLRETISSDAQITVLMAQFSDKERKLRTAKIDLLRLERSNTEDNRHRTQLRLLRNQTAMLEQELQQLQAQMTAAEKTVNEVWNSVVSSPTKKNTQHQPVRRISAFHRGSKELPSVLGRFEAHVLRQQRTHDIQVKAAALLAKPWQQQMEELQLRMVVKIQRAYRARVEARRLQQQAREQLADQIRQRDLKRQQQQLNQKRHAAVMDKDLQRHQARMLAKREQEEAVRAAMQLKQQQLLDKVRAEQIHQRDQARNQKRLTKCFATWIDCITRRRKRRQSNRLFLKFQFLKWRRHFKAVQHVNRAAVSIQRGYRRWKEKQSLRRIVQRNKKRQAIAARYLRKLQQRRLAQLFAHWTQWAQRRVELKANFATIVHRRQEEWFGRWVEYVAAWKQKRLDAALLVQRVYRGRLARQIFKHQRRRHRSAIAIQRLYRGYHGRVFAANRRRIKQQQDQGSALLRHRIQLRQTGGCFDAWAWYSKRARRVRAIAARRRQRLLRTVLCDGLHEYTIYRKEKRAALERRRFASAVAIQSHYRRYKCRVLFLESLRCHRAAITIQRFVRGCQARQRVYHFRREIAAARSLQTAWRRRLAARLAERTRAQGILLAAYKGDFTATQRAIASGYWYVTDDEGNGILHMAAAAGHKRLVKLCLRHQMDVNAVNLHGQTPLHLLLANLPPQSLSAIDTDEENRRVIDARIALAAYMIDHGAWHEAQDELGLTPLLLSAAMGQPQAVELLLERSADTDAKSLAGLNAAQLAVEGAHASTLRLLLFSRGFDTMDTLRLLHTCAGRGLLDCLKELLEYLAVYPIAEDSGQLDARDDDGYTPLIYAISSSDARAVALLLEHGASPDVKDFFGRAPIHFAVSVGERGAPSIVELLAQYDVDVDVKDTDGDSALHCCSGSDARVECTQLLLRHGAQLVANALGNHATHLAAQGGARETLQLLVEYGADMNLKNFGGKTPLGVARMHGQQRIVEYIAQYFASEDVGGEEDTQDGGGEKEEEEEEEERRLSPERTPEEWKEALATAYEMGTLAEWTHYVDAATETSFFARADGLGNQECTWTTPVEFDAALSDAWEVMRGGGPSVGARHNHQPQLGAEDAEEESQASTPRVQYFYHHKTTGELRVAAPPIDFALLQDVVQQSKRHQQLRQKIRRVSDSSHGASAMEYMRFFHEFEAESAQSKRESDAAHVIQRHVRAARTRRLLRQLLRENACAVELQRAFRGRQARRVAAHKRLEHGSATTIQSLYRGHRVRVAERSGARASRLRHRTRRLAAATVQRVYRGHQARRAAYRERVVQHLGPRGYTAWEQARRRARTVRRFQVWDEMELPREFPGVFFYCHTVTRSCSWAKPAAWVLEDARAVQTRTQLFHWGYTAAMATAASRLQALWRARQARVAMALILKAVRVMKTAEKEYLEDPTHLVKLANYTLFLHAVRHDYERARPLYARLMRSMAQRGPDVPFVLLAYALFLYVTQEDDVAVVEDFVHRALKLDRTAASFKLATLGFFRQAVLLHPHDSEANLNYAACLQWLYGQYEQAIPFYLHAIAANPRKKNAMELLQELLRRKKLRDKATRRPRLATDEQRQQRHAQYDSYEVFRRWQVEQAAADDRARREAFERERERQQREHAASKIQARYRRRRAMRTVNRAKAERQTLRSMAALAETKALYDRVSAAFDAVVAVPAASGLFKGRKKLPAAASVPVAKLEALFRAMGLATDDVAAAVGAFSASHGGVKHVSVMDVTSFVESDAALRAKLK